MTAQPNDPQPIASLDYDVAAYLDLTEQMEDLENQRATIRARLATRGVGTHTTTSGITVAVTAPSRRFNLERAWTMLTDDQKDVCTSPDAGKVKKQLSQVLVDTCMEPGTGNPRVSVK